MQQQLRRLFVLKAEVAVSSRHLRCIFPELNTVDGGREGERDMLQRSLYWQRRQCAVLVCFVP